MQYGYNTVPHLARVDITGPYKATGPGDTPSRRRIFVCHPSAAADEIPCARQILSNLVRRAFRRAPTDGDLESLLSFYQQERNKRGVLKPELKWPCAGSWPTRNSFSASSRRPPTFRPVGPYRISDTELASRLSFFLWSSIPDDELLKLAIQGKLHEPAVLERETRRMLADDRARALVTNFADQWLYLRDLKNTNPDAREFPDFDDNLRQAFQRETEMLFESILREDRSVLDLLDADYTFVNERLAKHYGIANIYGPDFRRVPVPSDARRGLLGQGSMLLVTSNANRTSPVQRGKWILENLLGSPPPLPPPNVPPLKENSERAAAHIRSRAHGSNTAPIRRVPDAIRSWTPSGSRSRISMESANGAPWIRAFRSMRPANWWMAPDGWPSQLAQSPAGPSRSVRRRHDGKIADVWSRPRNEVLRHAGGSRRYARMPLRDRVPVLRSGVGNREERPVSDENERSAMATAAKRRTESRPMMFITKKHLPRRTFLRGVGVTLALPLLDSMVPAQTPLGKTAAVPKSRFCGIYVPHGATMDKWTPAQEGSGFEFPETLKPLEKLRDRVCVVSNLAHPAASGVGSDAGADHARSAAVFLSGAHPEKGSVHAGMTLDQVLAQHIGQDTPLPSIELGIEEVGLNCGSGYGCAYFNTISWRTPTLPLPMENSPQVVFERLFGDGSQLGAAPFAEEAGPQHSRFRHRKGGAAPGQARSQRPRPPERVSRRHSRNRAPHPEGHGAVR